MVAIFLWHIVAHCTRPTYMLENCCGNLPSMSASDTGFDFFIIRWCCRASGWDVGPVSDYQLLCMKHRPMANGLSLDADVYKSILPWLLLFESC